jgi:hypothetical protein
MLEGEKAQIQKEKNRFLTEQTAFKEVVRKELLSMLGLEWEEHEAVEVQVTKLAKAIQQLQARVTELELQAVPNTSQEVCDQRE